MPRTADNGIREGTIHVTARVPRSLARRFAQFASEADRTVSAEVRRAMRQYAATRNDEAARAGGSIETRREQDADRGTG